MKNIENINSVSKIGNKSNGNIVIQNSNINMNAGMKDIFDLCAQNGQYDMINSSIQSINTSGKSTHPLYPYYSATYHRELGKLVSTPETEDAMIKYPKIIKGKYEIDKKKYPQMHEDESFLEYAYRTQTCVELNTIEYQEFLGDEIDAFPITKFHQGMKTVIGPPSFPKEQDAILISDNIAIPIKIRRKPCMEYGKVVIGNVSSGHGFDININIYEQMNNDKLKMTFTITKIVDANLLIQLRCENFLDAIYRTKNIKILINNKEFINASLNKDVEGGIFKSAATVVKYIERLLFIEGKIGCSFSTKIEEITSRDLFVLQVIENSLKNIVLREHAEKKNIEIDFDDISDEVLRDDNVECKFTGMLEKCEFELQGVVFRAEKYIVWFENFRITNKKRLIKEKALDKKIAQVELRSKKDKDTFSIYHKLEGIEVV